MIGALLLGLTGSFGHCVGMCSGVALLLSRQGATQGLRLLALHLGRITSYGLLGTVAGAFGFVLIQALQPDMGHEGTAVPAMPGLATGQGVLALLTAVLAVYMALAILGKAPSPELLLSRFTLRWGRMMRRVTRQQPGKAPGFLPAYLLGILWGLLPCGLVMAALLTAAVSGSPGAGALTMLAFGLGTWPVALGLSLVGQWRQKIVFLPQLRYAAAVIVMAFGLQMALRGLAAWGWINHLHWGQVMLW